MDCPSQSKSLWLTTSSEEDEQKVKTLLRQALPGCIRTQRNAGPTTTVNRGLQWQHLLIMDSQTMVQKSFQQQCQVANRTPVSIHAKSLLWSAGTSSSAPASASSRHRAGGAAAQNHGSSCWPRSSPPGGTRTILVSPPLVQYRQASPWRSRRGAPLAGWEQAGRPHLFG